VTRPRVTPLEVATSSVEGTRALAASLVAHLRAGDVILLGGDLGAGKTAFTQGLAAAAGVEEVVTSPTFTLVRPYRTAIGPDLLHADVYRLEQLREVVELGLPELLEEDAFAVVEWGERAAPALAADALHIGIELGERLDDRRFTVVPSGTAWDGRWTAVQAALRAAAE
jgi:tRNA threonylcarbamoyladenosine biosynthesis protein TsaE